MDDRRYISDIGGHKLYATTNIPFKHKESIEKRLHEVFPNVIIEINQLFTKDAIRVNLFTSEKNLYNYLENLKSIANPEYKTNIYGLTITYLDEKTLQYLLNTDLKELKTLKYLSKEE